LLTQCLTNCIEPTVISSGVGDSVGGGFVVWVP